jgi:multicomponent Na+:H+ antiporter subunit B
VIGRHESEIVRVVGWTLTPFILLFGLYVVAHGHYGPGGGFAGGVVLAVGVMLLRITAEAEVTYARLPVTTGPVTMSVGMLVFVLAGLVPLLAGGDFLDYAAVPVELAASRLRYLGILVVEVAIGFAVFGALLWIFDTLVGREAR